MSRTENQAKPLWQIKRLLSAFDAKDVRYVHWKSNTNIGAALAGFDDFDILIHPEDRALSEAVFHELCFIRAHSNKDCWQAGVIHFIGVDIASSALVHLHAHYALPVGFDYDKNFVLPVVGDYLNTRWKDGRVFLPEVEMEYAILVIRLILKHGLDTFLLKPPHRQVQTLLRASQQVITDEPMAEFNDLSSRLSRRRVSQILDTTFEFVSRDTFERCESVITANNSVSDFINSAWVLKRELRPYATNTPAGSFCKAAVRRYGLVPERLACRVFRLQLKKKMPTHGGRIIAFVGGDGAGKSTNVNALAKTLGAQFSVVKLHVGRPDRGLRGLLLAVAAKVLRRVGLLQFAQALIYLRVAVDRARVFRKARRLRQKGWLVVLDRFPLCGITHMDCPRIHMIGQGKFKRMACWEEALHAQIRGVDTLIVLKLDPHIALERRPQDDPEELLQRSGEIWQNKWDAPYAEVIDTGEHDLEAVRSHVLQIAWQSVTQPFLRIELLALSGAGKSTVVRELRRHIPNSRQSLPYKDNLFTAIRGALSGLPLAWRIYRNTGNWRAGKNGLYLFAAHALIRRYKKKAPPATHFLFDQGPAFMLALAEKDGGLTTNKSRQVARDVCRFVQQVYRLNVPVDTVYHRVHELRGQAGTGRAIGLDDKQQFAQFCADYDAALDKAQGTVGSHATVDATVGAEQVVSNILAQLGGQ